MGLLRIGCFTRSWRATCARSKLNRRLRSSRGGSPRRCCAPSPRPTARVSGIGVQPTSACTWPGTQRRRAPWTDCLLMPGSCLPPIRAPCASLSCRAPWPWRRRWKAREWRSSTRSLARQVLGPSALPPCAWRYAGKGSRSWPHGSDAPCHPPRHRRTEWQARRDRLGKGATAGAAAGSLPYELIIARPLRPVLATIADAHTGRIWALVEVQLNGEPLVVSAGAEESVAQLATGRATRARCNSPTPTQIGSWR